MMEDGIMNLNSNMPDSGILSIVETENLHKHIDASLARYSLWLRVVYDEETITIMIYNREERMTFLTTFDKDGALPILEAFTAFLQGVSTVDFRTIADDNIKRLYG